jgi:DNA helicase-2/ATP-dependent DNA helicase PcrA
LATLHKLATRVNNAKSLKKIIAAITEIVGTERFEPVEEGQEHQYTQPGQLTIMTLHKAKGLDWDYVFLPFLHEKSIPGNAYIPKGWQFLGNFTLSEVARAQIKTGLHYRYQGQPLDLPSPEEAWSTAERLKQAEEYRLLYVGMTRAKRLLWMAAAKQRPFMWNRLPIKGQQQLQNFDPCPLLLALIQKFPRSSQSS